MCNKNINYPVRRRHIFWQNRYIKLSTSRYKIFTTTNSLEKIKCLTRSMGFAHCYTPFSVDKFIFVLVKKQILVLEYRQYSPYSTMCDFSVSTPPQISFSLSFQISKKYSEQRKEYKIMFGNYYSAAKLSKLSLRNSVIGYELQ